MPTAAAGPVGITAGVDGVWFTEILANQAGRINADGTIKEYPLPAGSKPHAAATADGGCWLTLWGSGALLRLDADGNIVGEHPLGAGSEPHGLAIAGDAVWVALEAGALAEVRP
jgi:virginiamycin B lyase